MRDNPMPPLTAEERDALKADIEQRGIIYPVVINADGGDIIDGHTRDAIAQELGIETPVMEVETDEPEVLAYTLNLVRRQMPREQRDELIVDLRKQGYTVEQVAVMVGISKSMVSKVMKAKGEDISTSGKVDSKGRKRSPGRPSKEKPRIPPKERSGEEAEGKWGPHVVIAREKGGDWQTETVEAVHLPTGLIETMTPSVYTGGEAPVFKSPKRVENKALADATKLLYAHTHDDLKRKPKVAQVQALKQVVDAYLDSLDK